MAANYSSGDDFFVNSVDLSIHRPPPRSQNVLVTFVKNPRFLVALYLLYILLIAWLWGDLKEFLLSDILDDAVKGETSNTVEGAYLGGLIALPYLIYSVVSALMTQFRLRIPFFRNLDFLNNIAQVIFLFAAVASIYTLGLNVMDNTTIPINWNVVQRQFLVEVSEGPDFTKPIPWLKDVPIIGDSLAKATVLQPGTVTRSLITGLINTLRAVVLALIFSTVLGIFVGVGLLSNNWLARNVSVVYVEIFRNTPLLVQLFFIYRGLLGVLPTAPRDAYKFHNFYLSGRGFNFPKILTTETFNYFLVAIVVGLVLGIGLWLWRLKVQDETGKPANTMIWFLAAFLGFAAIGLLASYAAGGSPFGIQNPRLERFNFVDGWRWSGGYLTLVVGLTLYTGAFIADIVRAGIQSVAHGQIEAARAHGLTNPQTLRLVVLPQAMRLIIPPLTNQYLNLSKNSSLAIAIGFYDLYNVATVVQNQTGQSVALFTILMITYLVVSLVISFVMNLVNRSLRLKTR